MIKIKVKKENENIVFFEIKGHSNLADYGNDIVCSAVSSTTLMTLNSLIEVLKLKIEYEIRDGYTSCNLKDIKDDKAQFIISSYILFIEELAKQYPKNLKFKVMEV